tara:strand:+ start:480 stop:644 length:165 start_codon:yes stop_codon:yes gene_type:complete
MAAKLSVVPVIKYVVVIAIIICPKVYIAASVTDEVFIIDLVEAKMPLVNSVILI